MPTKVSTKESQQGMGTVAGKKRKKKKKKKQEKEAVMKEEEKREAPTNTAATGKSCKQISNSDSVRTLFLNAEICNYPLYREPEGQPDH